jgi:hypothetical protein
MLDTGAPTMVSRALREDAAMVEDAEGLEPGSLVGASSRADGVRATGAWSFALGHPRVERVIRHVWLMSRERPGFLGRCFPDGSLGMDALDGCSLVIGDAPEPSVFVRCAD